MGRLDHTLQMDVPRDRANLDGIGFIPESLGMVMRDMGDG